ncbi:LAME_0C01838g1_1 [Lachancea meyersii CBS 8951]|uniref:DNA-directed RNA polymerase III subunit RPC9 n=1 Tax=Lachancea meyersii CBS 8951 TaxID=1266667 RepID=A0A1G4IZM5_9SACH|nr:LAME_0C01838g1_1 [Lachancea meyersii CBS 8951]
MKIDTVRDAFLSDYEVLQFLLHLERRHEWTPEEDVDMINKKRKRRPYNHPELQAITRDTIRYLSEPKGAADGEDAETGAKIDAKSPLTKLNNTKFSTLMAKLNEFSLFKAEKLQIVNQMPTNLVHLYSIVEECDSRFTPEQADEIIGAVQVLY